LKEGRDIYIVPGGQPLSEAAKGEAKTYLKEGRDIYIVPGGQPL